MTARRVADNTPESAAKASGPLAKLKVLDLTRLLPGPMAAQHLADLGADVIKIEDTGAGDYARFMGPPPKGTKGGDSLFFQLINRNKKSLRLDLKQASGVDVFLRLAKDADVILESFRPGVVDKLGIGYAAVQALNQRVVYCSISGYGQTGPWAEKAGHDINYIATAGLLDQIGVQEDGVSGAPAIPNLQIGDLLGGALAPLVGLLAAVISAKTTGRGSQVDVSMTDAVFAHTLFPLINAQLMGRPAERGGDFLTGGVPCYGVYRTSDGRYLAVGALEPKFWQSFCGVIERPDLGPFGLALGSEGTRVRGELSVLFATKPLADWEALFADADCCVTPVLRMDEAMAHPQLIARDMLRDKDGIQHFAPPYKFSEWSVNETRAASSAGQHSAEILAASGYSSAEIDELRRLKVI